MQSFADVRADVLVVMPAILDAVRGMPWMGLLDRGVRVRIDTCEKPIRLCRKRARAQDEPAYSRECVARSTPPAVCRRARSQPRPRSGGWLGLESSGPAALALVETSWLHTAAC